MPLSAQQSSPNPEKRGTIVVLRHDPDMISLSATDNGKGFEVEENTSLPKSYSQEIGLIDMHESRELLGGRLEIDSEPGGAHSDNLRTRWEDESA